MGRKKCDVKKMNICVRCDLEDVTALRSLDCNISAELAKVVKIMVSGVLSQRKQELTEIGNQIETLEQERKQKKIILEEGLNAMAFELGRKQLEEATTKTQNKNLLLELDNFLKKYNKTPLFAFEELTGEIKPDDLFEQDLIIYLTGRGLPGDLNRLREVIQKPQKVKVG